MPKRSAPPPWAFPRTNTTRPSAQWRIRSGPAPTADLLALELFLTCSFWRASELLPVSHLEGVYLRSYGVLVYQRRQDVAPPLVVGGAHPSHDLRVLREHVPRFTGVGLDIVKFGVVDQVKANVADCAVVKLGGFGLALFPTTDVRE